MQSVLFSSVFSIHKNKDIDLLGEIILYIPQWGLDVSIDIWYTQVIEFFCNKWENNVLHCQKQQKDNFITKKMPRMPTRDTQFPVKSKLVWPYSLSDLPHQIENACSHLFLDSLHFTLFVRVGTLFYQYYHRTPFQTTQFLFRPSISSDTQISRERSKIWRLPLL